MFDYLLGVSQNFVAEIVILAFSLLAWRHLRRRWVQGKAKGRKVFAAVIRGSTGVVAAGCFVAAAWHTSFEHVLGAAVIAAVLLFVQLLGVGFLATVVRMVRPATSWQISTLAGYAVSAVIAVIAWIADVRVVAAAQAPRDVVMSNSLVLLGGFVLITPVASQWLARRLDTDDETTMPMRALTGFAMASTMLVGALARYHFTWPQALWYGPSIGAASLMATVFLFQGLVSAARSLTFLADDKGWLLPSPKEPDLSLPPEAPVIPPELSR